VHVLLSKADKLNHGEAAAVLRAAAAMLSGRATAQLFSALRGPVCAGPGHARSVARVSHGEGVIKKPRRFLVKRRGRLTRHSLLNRAYPLREGSGECDALIRFDARQAREFHAGSEKISFKSLVWSRACIILATDAVL